MSCTHIIAATSSASITDSVTQSCILPLAVTGGILQKCCLPADTFTCLWVLCVILIRISVYLELVTFITTIPSTARFQQPPSLWCAYAIFHSALKCHLVCSQHAHYESRQLANCVLYVRPGPCQMEQFPSARSIFRRIFWTLGVLLIALL